MSSPPTSCAAAEYDRCTPSKSPRRAAAGLVPDAVLADVLMPGPTGYELCERVKGERRLAHVPVVLLVGKFEPFNPAEARRVGAETVVTKPFKSIRDLVSKVGSLVGCKKEDEGESTRLAAYRKAAEKLSAARKKAARTFEQAIQKELNDLAMERTTVRVVVEGAPEARTTPDGIDRIDILIAPNRGEEPKAMQRIASGGELSRIQLAIAAALFKASSRGAAATSRSPSLVR